MGIDLTITPQRHDNVGGWFLAYDRISVDRDYALFEAIKKSKSHRLPENIKFDWYNDEGLEKRTKDAYGEDLTYAHTDELSNAFMVVADLSERNKALMAYLSALPHHVWVVLWWH